MTGQLSAPARQAVLLDAELIRRRRVELRMTERQLGRLAGQSGQLVRRVEAGLSHEGMTLRVAKRLAEALGLPLRRLFLHEGAPTQSSDMKTPEEADVMPDEPHADVAIIGALLAHCGEAVPAEVIASALGMPLSRVEAGITDLGDRLRGLGIALAVTGSGVAIAADRSGLPAATDERVRRATRSRRSLDTQEARMLLRVIHGTVETGASFDRPSGMILGRLAHAGAIELPAGTWTGANPPRLTSDVRFSLMLPMT